MSVSTDCCFDCGRRLWDDEGEPLHTCLWESPVSGEHWAWVQVCRGCAAQRKYQRLVSLLLAGLVVSALTALVAYPLLP